MNGQGVAEKNKVPSFAIAAPHLRPHERGLKYWFSPFCQVTRYCQIICDVLDTVPAEKRPKTVAIFQEQADWGVEQAEAFRKEAPSARLQGCGF